MIYVYTDGSVMRPTEGKSPGGWAFTYDFKGKQFKSSGCCKYVTNNQMEMIAVIKALQSLLINKFHRESVCVVSDSQYVVFNCNQYLDVWKKNKWTNSRGNYIKNKPFWKQIDYLSSYFNIRYKWVRGHNGHPLNELVDKLAREAALRALSIEELLNS